jgi:NAD(P)-dependent dehydrogenase (short-subunit alcohol dehydrogenase family)
MGFVKSAGYVTVLDGGKIEREGNKDMSEAVDKYGPEKRKNVHVMDLFRLDGRVALVTGGAGLYGSVISTALAEAGAAVVIAARTLNKCEDRAAELRDNGYQAFAMPLDLSQDDSIVALKERVLAECGRVDILFNNAAGRVAGTADEIMERKFSMLQTSMGKMSRSQWEGAMAVNASGMFICTQVFAEQMVAQGHGGSIVNISSIYGVVGPTFPIYKGLEMTSPPDYSFAKGGVINFTRYLATHYAQYGIRVNCISPGGYYGGQPEEFVRNYEQRTPLGRMALWNDLKGAAVFLASDAAQYVTGQNLAVDGGWTAW